ncbi:MAG TPA: hypothetical protein VE776_07370 [Actinomycetota bacterium]|jgi:hypothetical protein|nr:hypothetical protein [Actinomycetota bacterium]
MPVVERRQPWYRAAAFQVTVAVVVLVVTLAAAWDRTQVGWGRDDVRRFSSALRVQTDQLSSVLGTGTKDAPGMATAADLTSGKVKPRQFQARATGWSTRIDAIRRKLANITVGKPEAVTTFTGVPVNNVGGHVPLLTSVRDAYTAAVGFYSQAAGAYQRAAEAPAKSQLAQKLVTQAQGNQSAAGEAMDAAAALLARVMATYDLDVQHQLPGESTTGFGNRTGAAAQIPPGGGGLPPGGVPTGGDQGTQPGQGNQ